MPARAPIAVFLMLLLAATPALALLGAAPWVEGEHHRIRLVSGDTSGSEWAAAVEIELEDGWKTYWRNPGDSGIPPEFDFGTSANLEAAEARFPAPHRFSDGYSESIGYEGRVAFPVSLKPADPSRPVTLSLKLRYAVCEKICIPASAELSAEILPKTADLLGIASSAQKTLPQEDSDQRLNLKSVSDNTAIFSFAAPEGGSDIDLFVEPPKGWYLAMPKPNGQDAQGRYLFAISLAGKPKTASIGGAKFRVTGVSDKGSFERIITLEN